MNILGGRSRGGENQYVLCFLRFRPLLFEVVLKKSTFHFSVSPCPPSQAVVAVLQRGGWPRPAGGRGVDRVVPGDGPSMRPPGFVIRVVCEGGQWVEERLSADDAGCVVLGLSVLWAYRPLLVLFRNPSSTRVDEMGHLTGNDHISRGRGMFCQKAAPRGKRLFTFWEGVLLLVRGRR